MKRLGPLLLIATVLIGGAGSASARAPKLTNHQISQALNVAATDLVNSGETIYKQRGACGRTGRTSAECGIVLERDGEGGMTGSDWVPPGTCEVGVSVRRRKGGVFYAIDFAAPLHMQGVCPTR